MVDLETSARLDKNIAAILRIDAEKLFAEPREKLLPFYCQNCGFPLGKDEVYDTHSWPPGAKQGNKVFNCIFCDNPVLKLK